MAVRERDLAWEKYHQSLRWQIARRDADYLELHHDYMKLQLERDELRVLLLKTLCRYLVSGLKEANDV